MGGRRAGWRVALYYLVCWSVVALLVPHRVVALLAVAVLAIVGTAPIMTFVARGGWRAYPTAAFRLFVVRPVLYIQILLPIIAGAGLAGLALGAPWGAATTVGRIVGGAALGVMAVLLFAGYVGSGVLVVRHLDATVPGLPEVWAGTRIAQISDLHIGPHTSRRFLARVGRAITRLAPDLIAITGDLVDDQAGDVPHLVRAVEGMHAPLGVYVIPGNHDVYAGWAEVDHQLRAALPGATVLVNDARILERQGARLAIIGTGDPAGRRGPDGVAPDVEAALRSVPARTTTIALAHNPVLWPALAARHVALTLSGHTHWGQLAVPRWGWSLASPFLARAMGAHTDGNALLYINPGTGYWGLPFRLGAHPEITLVTLHSGQPAAIDVGRATSERALSRGWAAEDREARSRSATDTALVSEPLRRRRHKAVEATMSAPRPAIRTRTARTASNSRAREAAARSSKPGRDTSG